MKVGIIGYGCVGKAYVSVVSEKDLVFINDKIDQKDLLTRVNERWINDLEDMLEVDIIILCLPTPSQGDEIVLDAYIEVLDKLSNLKYGGSVVIKSTIIPNKLEMLFSTYRNMRLCYSPEFLREVSAKEDLLNGDMTFVGGEPKACEEYSYFIQRSKIKNKNVNIVNDYKALSMVKYIINVFLSTKVSFFNGIYEICKRENIDYETVKNLVILDERLGKSHMQVPGPDGRYGYGGMCFPKDTSAFRGYTKSFQDDLVITELIDSVININQKVR